MNETGIRPEVIEEIRELAKKYNVEKVLLFGSRARGDFYEKSDIDLAITGGDKLRFSLDIEGLTSTLLRYDIIDLDKTLKPSFLEAISKDGVVLYEKV